MTYDRCGVIQHKAGHVWTRHTMPCKGCGVRFRVDAATVQFMQEMFETTDEVGAVMCVVHCLACAPFTGHSTNPPGEVVPGTVGAGIYQEIPL
jgi:hypothetical protein